MIRPKNETECLLLSITINYETPFKQTHRKLTNPIFCFILSGVIVKIKNCGCKIRFYGYSNYFFCVTTLLATKKKIFFSEVNFIYKYFNLRQIGSWASEGQTTRSIFSLPFNMISSIGWGEGGYRTLSCSLQ